MNIRTDLATEFAADKKSSESGVSVKKQKSGKVQISTVCITTDEAAKTVGKEKGKYVTLETEKGTDIFETENLRELLTMELEAMIGEKHGCVMVVGIGNKTVTPDALGPKAAESVLATRHISGSLAEKIGLKGLRPVSVLSPGVLGQTGIEVKEMLEGAIKLTKPDAIILIDALAAREVSRLGSTVQISNVGISPGSGVGNSRSEISKRTVGVDCFTIGVPTVVDAYTLCSDLTGKGSPEHEPMIVTPRDIDRLIDRSSKVIADALNIVLQPSIDSDIILSVV